jgi:hypothetical protein
MLHSIALQVQPAYAEIASFLAIARELDGTN